MLELRDGAGVVTHCHFLEVIGPRELWGVLLIPATELIQ